MARFLNPYNFVRPLDKTPQIEQLEKKFKNAPESLTADEAKQLLLWRCPPPPHDRFTGLSGKITCKMTAVTPIFVSDGEGVREDDNGHRTFRFFNVDGQDIIPASSLRGAIRSVFEAVTNSSFAVFGFKDSQHSDFKPLFYRQLPEVALGLVPARVEQNKDSTSGFNLRLLTGSYDLKVESKNLYGAWIPQYPNPQILQKEEFDKRGNSRHKHLLTERDIVSIPDDLWDGSTLCWAYIVNTKYLAQTNSYDTNQNKGFPHWQVEHIVQSKQEAENWFRSLKNNEKKSDKENRTARYKLVSGYVYATGLNADVKQYERFFYEDQNKYQLPLQQSHMIAYNSLMRNYHERKEAIEKSLGSQSKNGRDDLQVSTFVSKLERLEEGTLVYAKLSGTDQNPKVDAIYPVAISRTQFERSVYDVVKQHHSYLLPDTNYDELSLADRVFGWVSQEPPKENDFSTRVAYKGRVRFSSAIPEKDTRDKNLIVQPLTLSILGSPHPTSSEFYLDGIRNIKPHRKYKHAYDERSAKIRGRKIYRHHKIWRKSEATIDDKTQQNRTIVGAHGANTEYEFTLHFENLQVVELGALLWTLRLSDNQENDEMWQGFHRIGFGKPLGFGSVTIKLDNLQVLDSRRYMNGKNDVVVDIEECIQQFKQAMEELYGKEFDQLVSIQDLNALLSEPSLEAIHYPRGSAKRNASGDKNFEWFVKNKEEENNHTLDYAAEDNGLPYL